MYGPTPPAKLPVKLTRNRRLAARRVGARPGREGAADPYDEGTVDFPTLGVLDGEVQAGHVPLVAYVWFTEAVVALAVPSPKLQSSTSAPAPPVTFAASWTANGATPVRLEVVRLSVRGTAGNDQVSPTYAFVLVVPPSRTTTFCIGSYATDSQHRPPGELVRFAVRSVQVPWMYVHVSPAPVATSALGAAVEEHPTEEGVVDEPVPLLDGAGGAVRSGDVPRRPVERHRGGAPGAVRSIRGVGDQRAGRWVPCPGGRGRPGPP